MNKLNFNNVVSLYKNKNYEETYHLLEILINDNNNITGNIKEIIPFYLQGLSAFKLGKYDLCILCFKKTIELFRSISYTNFFDIQEYFVWYNLGLAYAKSAYLKQANNQKTSNQFESFLFLNQNAIDCFQKVIDLISNDISIDNVNILVLAYYHQGYVQGRLKNYAEAIKLFDIVLELDTTIGDTWRNKCFAEFRSNNNEEEVIKCFENALDNCNNFPKLYNTYGFVLNHYRKYKEAEKQIKKSIDLDPDLPGAWRNLSYTYAKTGYIEKALRSINEGLKRDPYNIYGWIYKGHVHFLRSQQEPNQRSIELNLALNCFEKAIQINERNATAWNNKGICILNLYEKYDFAIECFRRAYILNPSLGEAYNNTGSAILRSKKFDIQSLIEAERLFSLAKDKANTNDYLLFADACRNLGYTCGLRGKDNNEYYKKAKKWYQESVENFTNAIIRYYKIPYIEFKEGTKGYKTWLSDLHRNIGFLFAKLGHIERKKIDKEKYFRDAERHYKLSIRIDNKNALAYNSYGYFIIHFLKDEKRFDEALTFFMDAIDVSPNLQLPHYHYNKGYVLYHLSKQQNDDEEKLNKLEESIKSFDNALLIDPSYVFALTSKAVVLCVMGKFEEAVECFEKIDMTNEEKYPLIEKEELDNILVWKSYALNNIGRYQSALEYCNKLINDYKLIYKKNQEFGSTNNQKKLSELLFQVYYHAGYAEFQLHKYSNAHDKFIEAHKIVPENKLLVIWMAMSKYMNKEYIKAKYIFEKLKEDYSLEEKEDYILETQIGLGLCNYAIGDIENSKRNFNSALSFIKINDIDDEESIDINQLKKTKAVIFYNLGIVFHQEDKLNEARYMFEQCLESDPSFFKAREAISKLVRTNTSNWFQYWFEGILIGFRFYKVSSLVTHSIKLIIGILAISGIMLGIFIPLYHAYLALTTPSHLNLELITVPSILAIIGIIILLSTNLRKIRLAVIELELETPNIHKVSAEPQLEFTKSIMPIDYHLASFRGPVLHHAPLPSINQLFKPLTMPSTYEPLHTLLEIDFKQITHI